MLNIEKEIQLIISYIYKKGEVNTTTTNNYQMIDPRYVLSQIIFFLNVKEIFKCC